MTDEVPNTESPALEQQQALHHLIPVINKLQRAFATVGLPMIELPQIVVVGDQNAGKSSVLESLVGEPILPRGDGLVTRLPIVLQLLHVERASEKRCEFLNEVITNFSEIPAKVQTEMDRKAGPNKNIVDDPIVLTVYSPYVVPLTVVDLPGIVRVAMEGQPSNIADQVRQLIMKYISTPDAIILAISAAANDLAAAESLKLAQDVDPTGERTIVVLTKLDMMGKGTSAEKVLLGKVIPVRLGIIGVINRSQEDIDNNVSVQKSLETERRYLVDKYPAIASQNGTPYLARQLNITLMGHIKRHTPKVEDRIHAETQNCERKGRDLGPELNSYEKSRKLLDLIERFCAEYKATISGCWRDSNDTNRLGGASIRRSCERMLQAHFGNGIITQFMPSEETVADAVRNSPGFEAIMTPEGAFVELSKAIIAKTESPTLECASGISKLLEEYTLECLEIKEMQQYPEFQQGVKRILEDMFVAAFQAMTDRLSEFIRCHTNYIDMDHEDFAGAAVKAMVNNMGIGTKSKSPGQDKRYKKAANIKVGSVSVALNPESIELSTPLGTLETGVVGIGIDNDSSSDSEGNASDSCSSDSNSTDGDEHYLKTYCETAKNWIWTYISIYLKSLKHEFRMSLAHYMVYYLRDKLYSELTNKLYRPEEIPMLIDDTVANRERENNERMLEALHDAAKTLKETRRF